MTVWSKDGDCFVDRVAGVLLQERGRFARWGEAGPFAWTVNAIAAQVASCVNVWIWRRGEVFDLSEGGVRNSSKVQS